jgi:hypothetical protein
MSKQKINKHEALNDDPEFYFDENNFLTVVLNSEDFSKKNSEEIKNLVDLISSEIREDKDKALILLKQEDGRELLLSAIANKSFRESRSKLIAACWESGLDFSKYLEAFVILILSGNYMEALEALTVIENMESKLPEEIKMLSIKKMEEACQTESEKNDLLIQAISFLQNYSPEQ